MYIAFFTSTLEIGGAERQLTLTAKGFHELGHKVVVVVLYPNGYFERELRDAGVHVEVLGKKSLWDMPAPVWKLLCFLRREKPDILLSYLEAPNVLAVLLHPFFRRTKIAWNVAASFIDLKKYHWLAALTFKISKLLSHYADLIIVNSRSGMVYHRQHGYPESKMVVIPNGINISYFKPDSVLREQIRKEWGLSDNQKLIGLVGRLDPMKDHPTFLKAASKIVKEKADVSFVCVGDGTPSYRQELQSLSEELELGKKIIWAGSRKDMPAVYNGLDIAVSSSYGEGLPNVVCEAMASCVPCVVTDVGDSAYVVGDTGIVVPPGDPDALAEGIRKLLDSDLTSLGLKARQRIVDNFSMEQLVERTEKALVELCADTPP